MAAVYDGHVPDTSRGAGQRAKVFVFVGSGKKLAFVCKLRRIPAEQVADSDRNAEISVAITAK